MKRFEFFDESNEDFDGWWGEVYSDGENTHYSLISVLDFCVTLEDKLKISLLPEHSHWHEAGEHLFSEIDNLDIKSLEKPLLGMGYNITIDGVCIFKYDTQHQGYIKSVSGAYTPLPTLVNRYIANTGFICTLRELLKDSGVDAGSTDSGAITAFLNLVHIRDKMAEVLPYLVDSSNI